MTLSAVKNKAMELANKHHWSNIANVIDPETGREHWEAFAYEAENILLRAMLGPTAVAAILAGEAEIIRSVIPASEYGLDHEMKLVLTEAIYRGDKHLNPTVRCASSEVRLDKPEQGHE